MLVAEWEALYGAIPRLQAEEQLMAFTVATVAQPAADHAALRQKQGVVESWRQQMQGAVTAVREAVSRVSFPQLARLLRGAFEEQIRD